MNSIKKILACIRTADKKFNLIENEGKIAIGISGGKDSMLLFYALHLYSKFSFNNFKIVPIMIDLGFDNFNPEPIRVYLSSFGYDLKIYDAKNVYQILKLNTKENHHLPCSICSKMKKAIINKAAKKYKCNKVAFAHHADDAIETLFMNEISGGKIDTFSPKMFLTREKITFIRPLILVFEKDIIRCVKENDVATISSNCPADKLTQRQDIKELLSSIYKQFPESHENFLTMITNYDHIGLWDENEFRKIQNSNLSLKICLNKNDYFNLFNLFKINKFHNNYIYYLIYEKNNIIGCFSYYLKNKNIYLNLIKILKNSAKPQYFLKIIKEIEVMLFEKYNPCILYTKLKNNYFKEKYKKEDNTFYLPLNGKLSKILK